MDFSLYWFMLPVSTLVATTAMVSGIGGAAMFTPIFLIGFPLLGPEYLLPSAVAAIGVALLTETFGFSSGFVGYYRKRLIDFRGAMPFIAAGVPFGIFGAIVAQDLPGPVIKGAYAILLLVIAVILYRHHAQPTEESAPATAGADQANHIMHTITGRDGAVYRFRRPRQGIGILATGIGAFLTGIASVGIGESVMPQLVRRNHVPIPVAAATSVFVVIVIVAATSFTLISELIREGGASAVPWHLVAYTIPGVIIGGQIGPRLQGKIPVRMMERGVATLFLAISLAMAWLVWAEIGS
jgi:uncharacterized protein